MSKSILALLLPAVLAACDRELAPRPHGSAIGSGGRFGDFVLPMRDIGIPATVNANDTVTVRFAIDGADPCAYSTAVTITAARVTYVEPWGVNHPGSSCRETTFPLVFHYAVERPPQPVDPIYHRVVICLPNGSYERHDVLVRVPWPTQNGVGPKWPDRTRKVDEAQCADFRKWVLSG